MSEQKKERRAWGTGRIFKRKRSRYWYIRWYDANGKRRTEATKTTRRSEAERILRERLGEKARGENPDADRITFRDLIQLLKDDRAVKGCRSKPKLKHLEAAFDGMKARAINGLAITAYERRRLEAAAARATVNQELATLRRAFNVAVEKGLLTGAQIPKIRTPDPRNARQGFFEAADFEAGVVRLEPNTTKNDEGRTFPFDALPKLRAPLEERRAATTALERERGALIPWVFHHDGQPIRSYDTAWRGAVDRAAHEERNGLRVVVRPQLVGRLVHDLRRTAVRNLERAGVPRSVAMKLTGHKTESVYRRYAIVSETDLREGVARLAEKMGGTLGHAASKGAGK